MNDFIPTYKAWDRVAKMLFPDVDLVGTRTRDRYLIKRYRRPTDDITFKNQPAPLLPGGITYVTGFQQAGRPAFAPAFSVPKELIVEVDQAYFRQPLRKEVSLWFTQRGFDVMQRTISKKDFEAALVKAGLPEAKVAAKPGPKPDFDWEMIEAKCYDLMDYHGPFMRSDEEWDCQARLETALRKFCDDTWGRVPADSTLREKLPKWLSAWYEKTGAA